ncbi:hypothetical protein LQV63_20465 [Paenibacillus profundus]|uniref:Transposase InsH N-terminal domain-containing protein n=1 Tax=Paenibacillus profundus TaxID=1173085 RepID=A0ABS8YJC6_9BACL|nr:hypothetical protein [Paenibacillus profundus]
MNRLDDQLFAAAYPGGGRHSYHPKMLTKVILYAYTQRVYSSRLRGLFFFLLGQKLEFIQSLKNAFNILWL